MTGFSTKYANPETREKYCATSYFGQDTKTGSTGKVHNKNPRS